MVSGRTGTIFQSDYLHIIPVEQAAQIKRTGKHTITLPNVTAHEHFAMHERGLSYPMETPPVPGPDQRGPSYSHFRQHVHQAHLLPSAASHRSVRKAKHILNTAEKVVFLHHTRVVKYFRAFGLLDIRHSRCYMITSCRETEEDTRRCEQALYNLATPCCTLKPHI